MRHRSAALAVTFDCPWNPLPFVVPVTSTTSPAWKTSTLISLPTSYSPSSTFLNSLMKRLGAVFAFAT